MRELTPAERATIYNRRLRGESLSKIAKDYQISKEGVNKIAKRLEARGSAENAPRTGRKRKTTKRQDRLILREVRQNPSISAREVGERLNLPIKRTQIRSRIHEANLQGRVARKCPFITKTNAKKRLLFAKQYRNEPITFWERIIFSDEAKFELLGGHRRRMVWRKKGEAFTPTMVRTTVKHGGGSVLVWGCFGASGVGNLAIIEGTLTGEGYVNILKDNLFQSVEKLGLGAFIYQQDNDPKHTSRVAKNFFNENQIELLPWPPQSPDLNPIEHLWDHLDRNIPDSERKSKISFIAAIKRVWDNTPQETLTKLIQSMPNRLAAVIKANGFNTPY